MDINRFTEKAQEALAAAQQRATRAGNQQVDVEHLLATLLDQEPGLAGAILRKACEVAHVEPDGIEMLRFGDHAVFRIDGGRIVSRVGRSPDRLPSVRREVAVAEWLASEGYPAARLVTAAEQPVVVQRRQHQGPGHPRYVRLSIHRMRLSSE